MRIRLPFAAAFFILLLISAYLGLTTLQVPPYVNDKVIHVITFFLLTLTIYWIPDTTRRRTLHLTLVLSLSLSLFSEILQAILPNDREFDIYDIVANVTGSLGAIGICGWYHKRMLERRRRAKGYVIVDGDVDAENEGAELAGGRAGDEDLELGRVGGDNSAQESGVVESSITVPRITTNLDEEVDNWDENGLDNWDDDDHGVDSGDGEGPKTPSASSAGEVEGDVKSVD